MTVTPRCKPIPMPDDVIVVINQMGEDNGSPEGIVFCSIHKVLTVEDLYPDVDSQDDSNNASDTSWNKKKHCSDDYDKNILYDDDIEYNQVDDLNKDNLHLHSGLLGDNINNSNNKLQ